MYYAEAGRGYDTHYGDIVSLSLVDDSLQCVLGIEVLKSLRIPPVIWTFSILKSNLRKKRVSNNARLQNLAVQEITIS